jgi:hypothetical protein
MRILMSALVLLTAFVATPAVLREIDESSSQPSSKTHQKVLDLMCGSQCEKRTTETHLTGDWYMVERPLVDQSGTFTVIGGGRDDGLFFAGTPAFSPTAQQNTIDAISSKLAQHACGASAGVTEVSQALRRSRGGVPVEMRMFLRLRTSPAPAESCEVALTDEEDKVIVSWK